MKLDVPFAFLILFCCGNASAQVYSSNYYGEEARKAQEFVPLSTDDDVARVNLQDGSISFDYNDIDFTVSDELSLSFGRTAGLGGPAGFATWDLNVPYMVGTYSSNEGWNAGSNDGKRCSSGNFAPKPAGSAVGALSGNNWWRGVQIYMPGKGSETLLNIDDGAPAPQDGNQYYGVTKSHSRVRCLSSIKNGSGEGFVVVTASGTKYFFDWMSTQPHYSISGMVGQYQGLWLSLSKVFLLATRVEDRHGNYITYNYSGAHNSSAKLISISASDGSQVEIEYDQDRVRFARHEQRSWEYRYARIDSRYETLGLSEVINPDQSRWTFSGPIGSLDAHIDGRAAGQFFQTHCALPAKILGTGYVGYSAANTRGSIHINHPSGLESIYDVELSHTGINQAPGYCVMDTVTRYKSTMGVPFAYLHYAIKSKSLAGPGLVRSTWEYSYDQSWSFAGAASSSDRSRTNIISPDGTKVVYEFGNVFSTNFGQLLVKNVYQGSQILRQEKFEYVQESQGQPFPDRVGEMPHRATNGTAVGSWGNDFWFKNRPLSAKTIVESNVTFRTNFSEFDYFARPARIVKSSTGN
ncbi:hypothetical protein [Luteimonas sp. 3794]|uniref:hypothetical protein n=1 Tax=Luteimonas sp. 3794 TaxID=2817730 RepID=UPI0028620F36|nr:hypothetical protein [Luteimonas sp. 3794]MDR6990218.1 hypothetical protein [Luteimonas sp. 3794]